MKPQKALHKYKADEKKTQNYRGHQYLMFPKLDGWYGYYDIGSNVGISSNAQRVIPSCADRTRKLKRCLDSETPYGRLIFEITVDGTPQFETMNGILNRKAICPEIRLNVHDFIPLDTLDMWTLDRYHMAMDIVHNLDLSWVEVIKHHGASSVPEEWESKARQLIDRGIEGLIMKKLEAEYSPGKRNEDLLKIKEECEFDLLCIGFIRGSVDSKYANTVGALLLEDRNGIRFTASGMTDKQRYAWFNESALVVRRVVKVTAKNIMKTGSLREPRFNVIRYDKNANDIDIVE